MKPSWNVITWKFLFMWVFDVVVLCLHSWLEAGDTNLMRVILLNKLHFDCYNLNDRGRMEIDHVFASGAVVGRATTHEWGRSSLRAELGDPKSGQFL